MCVADCRVTSNGRGVDGAHGKLRWFGSGPEWSPRSWYEDDPRARINLPERSEHYSHIGRWPAAACALALALTISIDLVIGVGLSMG